MTISPTQLSLKWLRERGFIADVVERWHGGNRHDLFGFADILAVLPYPGRKGGVLLVQTTTTSHVHDRFKKMEGITHVKSCLRAGCSIQIHGWAKRGERGKRKLWTARTFQIILHECCTGDTTLEMVEHAKPQQEV